ncbi:MAG TPA: gluconate 2-dehydrogenase subunit 3 family protein [Terriglobia bacterium]|nr:gluconate 2-dehydrogenase subunit 3 family protein [Terriglobia bacterium]
MERRTALKIVALSALAPKVSAAKAAAHGSMESGTAWTPEAYKLEFFTEAENKLLDGLMEMIIPEDSHSPGAHAAHVSLFADLMVATSDEATKAHWKKGLALMQVEADKSSVAEALTHAAALAGQPASELGRFFGALKEMTVNGYYTSEIGIHQDLQYVGNTYLSAFPGCTHKEHW